MHELNLQEQDQQRPCRPFTAYNIFFHLEKERVLQEQGQGYAAKIETIDPINRELDMGAALRPIRYQHLALPAKWYVPDPGKKRRLANKKNRAPPHGIFTFVELSKMISSEWKGIDEETRTYCTELADAQLELYVEEMKVFVAKYGAAAAKKSSKSTTKRNKAASRGKKTTKAAGKLGDNKLPPAPDRDDQKCKGNNKSERNLNENNGIQFLYLRQDADVNCGQQVPGSNCGSFVKDYIEPESLSSTSCDYISPMLSYWANKVANGSMELEFDSDLFDTEVSTPHFCSQGLTSMPGKNLLLDGSQAAGNIVNTEEMFTIESASELIQRSQDDEYFGRCQDDIMEGPDQVYNCDIKDFDWTWNQNTSFVFSLNSMKRKEIDHSVQDTHDNYQDCQDFHLLAFQRQTSDQPYSLTCASSPPTGVSHVHYPFHSV